MAATPGGVLRGAIGPIVGRIRLGGIVDMLLVPYLMATGLVTVSPVQRVSWCRAPRVRPYVRHMISTTQIARTPDRTPTLRAGSQLVIDALELNGVSTIYGVAGTPVTDLGRLAQAKGIRYVDL